MKADVSRYTFDPLKGYARVLQQQGRPQLDSDWNEQVAILLHRLHMLGRDLIGPAGGPSDACGFEINGVPGAPHDFEIGAGRYYVNGVLCDNPIKTRFSTQPVKIHQPDIETGKFYLVFLDVWEEVVSVAHEPNLLEPALGGIDTALRSRIAWQVRTHAIEPGNDADFVLKNWPQFVENWQPRKRGALKARISNLGGDTSPVRRYRGLENQLYRIEIHYGGEAAGGQDGATFKWSRENGAIMLKLHAVRDNVLALERLDASGAGTLAAGDWLEEVTPGLTHPGTPRAPLIRVVGRGPGRDEITIDQATVTNALDPHRPGGLWLRRWDQRPRQPNQGGRLFRDGTITMSEADGDAGWIALENGVEVQFAPGAEYRPGDHWLIPARIVDDGMLLWRSEGGSPVAMPPFGVDHGYAPLAIVTFNPIAERKQSCRRQFRPLATLAI